MKTKNTVCLFIMLSLFVKVLSQNDSVSIPIIGEKFPHFVLPVYQGGEFSNTALQGKTLLLISSRGQYAPGHWCAICNYQYADFASLVTNDSLKEKYNLEIVFLMPYSKDTLAEWEKAFPKEMEKIENWKYPPVTDDITPQQYAWSKYTQQLFPKTFVYNNSTMTLPISILMDADHEVSTGLDIFRTEWDDCKADQNIPSIYIVDKDGILQYKYISQNTFDRPSSDYIIRFIQKMLQE